MLPADSAEPGAPSGVASPVGVALVPGLGLVVLCDNGLHVYASTAGGGTGPMGSDDVEVGYCGLWALQPTPMRPNPSTACAHHPQTQLTATFVLISPLLFSLPLPSMSSCLRACPPPLCTRV